MVIVATSADLRSDLMDDLVQTSFAVAAVLTRVGAAHDLSLTLLRLLGILRDRQPKMAELADYLVLEKSTVSGLIDRAETRGLVQRSTTPEDGRSVRVGLSTKGRRLVRTVEAEIAGALAPLTARLTPQDQRQVHTLLARMLTETAP